MAGGPGNGNRPAHQPHRRMRVYEQWQGNEKFFCHGYLMAGPNWLSGMGSVAIIVAPTVLFLVFIAPYMGQHVSWAILGVSIPIPCVCLAMLLTTACSDPGVLPRQEPDEEWLAGRKPRTKDVMVNGHRVQVRYNDTCHFYQPPRAHHCSVNDNCIERFDHHCPWVGTTIGKRNYRTFLLFVYSTSLYICWTFAISLWCLFVISDDIQQQRVADGTYQGGNYFLNALATMPGPICIIIIVVCLVFGMFLCGLSGFHSYLTATNQTTYENFRYNRSQTPNPYDQGILRNCASVWCGQVPPSKVDFRAYVDEARGKPKPLPELQSYVSTTAPSGLQEQPSRYDSFVDDRGDGLQLREGPRQDSFLASGGVVELTSAAAAAASAAGAPSSGATAQEPATWHGHGGSAVGEALDPRHLSLDVEPVVLLQAQQVGGWRADSRGSGEGGAGPSAGAQHSVLDMPASIGPLQQAALAARQQDGSGDMQ